MKKAAHSFLIFLFAVFAVVPLSSLDVPPLEAPVNDLAGILGDREEQELNDYLREVQAETGVQIAVLSLPSLDGETLEPYAEKVFNRWGLGTDEKDDGVLLLFVMDNRAIRIEVGYGLESVLTDAKCGLIIRNIIAPRFRDSAYGQGILEACKNINVITADAGAGTEAGAAQKTADEGLFKRLWKSMNPVMIIFFIFFAIIFIVFIAAIIYTIVAAKRGTLPSRNASPGAWHSDSSSSGSDSFSSSSDSYSGGGGDSGGGGASGSW